MAGGERGCNLQREHRAYCFVAAVERMFAGIGRVLQAGGMLCLYGPFNYGGNYTSDSNARFDAWLKNRDPESVSVISRR